MGDYLSVNRANWDERALAHAASAAYALDKFLADPSFLSTVVSFDRDLLGDVSGADGVHLQCHIGTDTISLARLGAVMTGLDFSPASLHQARRLAAATGTPVRFVESEVYGALNVLPAESFDLVYTGIGALCWLPNISRWAQIIAGLLRPGGRLFIRDGHPMLSALDEAHTDRLVIDRPYFQRHGPLVFDEGGTYVDTEATFSSTRTLEWNRGIGEIVSALLEAGLHITGLVEHDSVPWEALPGQMARDELGEWRLSERPWRLAASFTLQARRP